MAERNWTKEQQNAIDARNGTLLLSAAAGSGKTAVLVERIIRLMTEGSNPVDPSELLVVTFTNAAAAEMKTRIASGIDALIRKEPTNNLYRSVKMKLPSAAVSTIDSFCIKLVRENFHKAGIAPDFAILDNSDEKILIAEAMSATLDTLCQESPDIYDLLNSMTAYNCDDSALSQKILRLYRFSLAHPFPEKWLREVEDMYRNDQPVADSVWGKIILEYAENTFAYSRELLEEALKDILPSEVIAEKYEASLQNVLMLLDRLDIMMQNKDWDALHDFFRNFTWSRLPTAPKGYGDDPYKLAAEAKYKAVASLFEDCGKMFCADTAENREDLEKLAPVIKELLNTVRAFGKNYESLKEEQNRYTFTDIMHRALRLLIREEDGEIRKTPLASSLEAQYREILIDEYQDTNEAQDMLFATLSRNGENLFMVGDVKQSIYRFRLAMPEIFVKKSREYADFDNKTYPAKIILGKNFRSRKGILDGINFLFQNLMSDYAGEMEYTEKEALHYGDTYPPDEEPATELRFLEASKTEEEAAYIAKLIDDMLQNGAEVTERGVKRKAKKSDFCILMRSPSGKLEIYENALKQRGIASSGDKKSNVFDAPEVGVFLSLLKVINNPTDDVAFLSLMLSPLYGFTADELADLKLPDKKRKLIACLREAADHDEKCARLLFDLDSYRKQAAVMPFDAYIRTLLDRTGYLAVVSAMKHGEVRRRNLILLCEFAASYAENGGSGISGFLRYIARAAENGADIPAASETSENADVVRIYSIHKSKGLEFPFVILADCAKPFNKSDMTDDMIISPSAGVGMVIINNERKQKYPTIGHTAARLAVKRASISEELRVLYVAMTRAKEKLIAVSTVAKHEKAVSNAVTNTLGGRRIFPCAVLNATSYTQWFLMGYLSHPDLEPLTRECGLTVEHRYDAPGRIRLILDKLTEEQSEITEETVSAADPVIIEAIRDRAEYEYPYILPADARPKRAASDFEEQKFTPEYFAVSKPSFLCSGELTPAQIGTANHLFLQHLDFGASSAEAECERMTREKILTPQQAAVIHREKVEKFLRSPLCERIRHAENVLREKEFTVEIELGDIEPTAAENVRHEKILVLGKTDLVFIRDGQATVVDYKTDRTKTEDEFIEAYRGQLTMYRRAIEQILGLPVAETLIYSLELGKEIAIPFTR